MLYPTVIQPIPQTPLFLALALMAAGVAVVVIFAEDFALARIVGLGMLVIGGSIGAFTILSHSNAGTTYQVDPKPSMESVQSAILSTYNVTDPVPEADDIRHWSVRLPDGRRSCNIVIADGAKATKDGVPADLNCGSVQPTKK